MVGQWPRARHAVRQAMAKLSWLRWQIAGHGRPLAACWQWWGWGWECLGLAWVRVWAWPGSEDQISPMVGSWPDHGCAHMSVSFLTEIRPRNLFETNSNRTERYLRYLLSYKMPHQRYLISSQKQHLLRYLRYRISCMQCTNQLWRFTESSVLPFKSQALH